MNADDFKDVALNGIKSITTTGSITAGTYFIGNLRGRVVGDSIGTIYAPPDRVAAYGNIVGQNGLTTNIGDPNYKPALVDGISIQGLNQHLTTFDFGVINPVFVDPISFLLWQTNVDLGTFGAPAAFGINAGSFIKV